MTRVMRAGLGTMLLGAGIALGLAIALASVGAI